MQTHTQDKDRRIINASTITRINKVPEEYKHLQHSLAGLHWWPADLLQMRDGAGDQTWLKIQRLYPDDALFDNNSGLKGTSAIHNQSAFQ